MEPIPIGEHLVIDPRVCHGRMTFKGTRMTVEAVLCYLALGDTMEQILEGWPYLKQEAIEEAIRIAANAWPELLRKKYEQAIRRLAAELQKRDEAQARSTNEPAPVGRTA